MKYILLILLLFLIPVYAQTNKQGVVSSLNISDNEMYIDVDGIHETISLSDGNISSIWENVPSVDIPSFGTSGSIQSVYSDDYVYFLVKYDISNSWIAFEWDSDYSIDPEDIENQVEPMSADDDMWVIGDADKTGILGDASAVGQGIQPYLKIDEQNDLLWERILIGDTYFVEIKRLLNTEDTTGFDIQFTREKNSTLLLASSEFHKFDFKITQVKFHLSNTKVDFASENNETNFIPPVFINGYSFFTLIIQRGLILGIMLQLPLSIYVYRRKKND